MNIEKISQYFFIIAAVVSILDGALSLSESMNAIKFVVLIFSGLIVGMVRNTKEKEFLLSGIAVVIVGYVFVELLGNYLFLEGLGLMILNFIIFLSSALLVVGISQVGGILTGGLSTTPKKKKKLHHMSHKELSDETFTRVWGIILLVSVAFTFIILLGEMFFDISLYQNIFIIVDSIITIIFILDLFILYQRSSGFNDFVKNNIFDIIAAIPTVGALRGLKIFRAVRIIKSFNKGFKATKLIKMYKTSKFFSEGSYFNHVNTKENKK